MPYNRRRAHTLGDTIPVVGAFAVVGTIPAVFNLVIREVDLGGPKEASAILARAKSRCNSASFSAPTSVGHGTILYSWLPFYFCFVLSGEVGEYVGMNANMGACSLLRT